MNQMMTTVQKLFKSASALTREERERLADMLLETLDYPVPAGIEDSWKAELDRRGDEIDRGDVKTIPWEDVHAELKRSLRGKKR